MKMKVLGCYGGNIPGHGMTSFLLNDELALDAGWVSNALSLKQQEKVKDILISHSHLDHTCTLPFLIDNNFSSPGLRPPDLRDPRGAHLDEEPPVQQPHLARLHVPAQRPDAGAEAEGDRARGAVRHQRADHPGRAWCPTSSPPPGFIVEDKKTAIAFSSDTGPTERFWELVELGQEPEGGGHRDVVPQRPAGPRQRVRPPDAEHARPPSCSKLKKDVPVYLYGCKPKHLKTIKKEIARPEAQEPPHARPGQDLQLLGSTSVPVDAGSPAAPGAGRARTCTARGSCSRPRRWSRRGRAVQTVSTPVNWVWLKTLKTSARSRSRAPPPSVPRAGDRDVPLVAPGERER